MSSCQPDDWLSDTLLERYWLAERTSEVQTDGPTFEAMPPNLFSTSSRILLSAPGTCIVLSTAENNIQLGHEFDE